VTKPSLLDLGGATPLESTPLMMKPRLLSIGEVCMETGLTVDVIRVWERRYGFPVPLRLPSGHRRYRMADLYRLRLMAEAMARGHRASKVVSADEATIKGMLLPRANPRVDALFAAVLAEDLDGMRCLMVESLSQLGWADFTQQLVFPLLDRVSLAWAEGSIRPEHEALVVRMLEGLLRRLRRDYHSLAGQGRVLLCTLPGENRNLDLLLAGLAYAVQGARTNLLGPDASINDIARSARILRVDVVGVTLSAQNTGESVRSMLMDLKDRLPLDCRLLVGGRGAARTRKVQGVERMDVVKVA